MPLRHASVLFAALSVACITHPPNGQLEDSSTGSTESTDDDATTVLASSTGSSGDSGGGSASTASTDDGSSETTAGTYVRECQPDDFACENSGDCDFWDAAAAGGCYKRCTPDAEAAIGAPDDECDEPSRPYCSQIGLVLGGDFNCNGCAHVCTAESVNVCENDIASCS